MNVIGHKDVVTDPPAIASCRAFPNRAENFVAVLRSQDRLPHASTDCEEDDRVVLIGGKVGKMSVGGHEQVFDNARREANGDGLPWPWSRHALVPVRETVATSS